MVLISLTEKCLGNCSHCMNDCNEYGKHMSEETLDLVIKFLKEIQPMFIVITGGEFTEHPYFDKFILKICDAISQFPSAISLLSNGLFILNEENTKRVRNLLNNEHIALLQITTGEKFYPKFDLIEKNKQKLINLHKKVEYTYERDTLLPRGRAIINHKQIIEASSRKPSCIDLYLLVKQMPPTSLKNIINYLQIHTRYNNCKPHIDINGNILAGESNSCYKIGHIKERTTIIMNRILKGKPCNQCGLVKNLPNEAIRILSNIM
jgi:organic radical activating enzyme